MIWLQIWLFKLFDYVTINLTTNLTINLKENYIPVIILSNIFKTYETWWYNELSSYFEDIFSDYQFGFCKGISAQ